MESELFAHKAIRAGVSYKWKEYARRRFHLLALLYLAYNVGFFCYAITETVGDGTFWIRCTPNIFIIPLLLVELVQLKKLGWAYFSGGDLLNFLCSWNMLQIMMIILTPVCVLDGRKTLRAILSLVVFLNDFYLLRGFKGTGPYVRTILEIVNDLQGFMVLY